MLKPSVCYIPEQRARCRCCTAARSPWAGRSWPGRPAAPAARSPSASHSRPGCPAAGSPTPSGSAPSSPAPSPAAPRTHAQRFSNALNIFWHCKFMYFYATKFQWSPGIYARPTVHQGMHTPFRLHVKNKSIYDIIIFINIYLWLKLSV